VLAPALTPRRPGAYAALRVTRDLVVKIERGGKTESIQIAIR